MLNYAREPDAEWGPAKDVNRFGRYKPKRNRSISFDHSDMIDDDDSVLNSKNIFRIRL